MGMPAVHIVEVFQMMAKKCGACTEPDIKCRCELLRKDIANALKE